VAAASSVRGGFLGTKTLRNGYLPRSSGASTCFELIYAMVVASDYEDVFHVYTMYSIFHGSGNKASLLGHLCHLISVFHPTNGTMFPI